MAFRWTFGRCVHGSEIDWEMGDLVLPDISPAQDHGRFFRYLRYNADLSQEGLDALGLNDIEAAGVQKMDAVDQIENLSRIGKAVTKNEASIDHFGAFV
jgi:hypothetical protein